MENILFGEKKEILTDWNTRKMTYFSCYIKYKNITKEKFIKRIIQIQKSKNKLKQISENKKNKTISLPEVFFEDDEI